MGQAGGACGSKHLSQLARRLALAVAVRQAAQAELEAVPAQGGGEWAHTSPEGTLGNPQRGEAVGVSGGGGRVQQLPQASAVASAARWQ